MARSIEQLQSLYNSKTVAPGGRRGFGPPGGGPGPRGRMPGMKGGKPKNTGVTIKRLFSYIAKYKLRLLTVLLCMLTSTVTSLCGSYVMFPIINRIAGVETTLKDGYFAVQADNIIENLSQIPFVQTIMQSSKYAEVMTYLFAATFVMLLIYVVGSCATYLQSRLMLSIIMDLPAPV